MIAFTSLERIQKRCPPVHIEEQFEAVLASLNLSPARARETALVSLVKLARVCGLETAGWCLRAVPDVSRSARLFSCDLAYAFVPFHQNPAVIQAVEFAQQQIEESVDTARLYIHKAAIRRERFFHKKHSPVFLAMNIATAACHIDASQAAAAALSEALVLARQLKEDAAPFIHDLFVSRFGKDDPAERIAMPLVFEKK